MQWKNFGVDRDSSIMFAMRNITIGFIGTGHMGGAIAKRLSNVNILLNNRSANKAQTLAKAIGDNAQVCDPLSLCAKSRFVFLGVKPADMQGLSHTLSTASGEAIFVSMAAGLSLSSLEALFPGRKLIRIMPNTPVEVGKGITFVSFGNISEEEKAEFFSLMAPCGQCVEIEESKIDAASVLTGSAPAYLDYFLDALAEAGTKLGLSKEEATAYSLAMAEGAVALAKQSNHTPKELGAAVCSPGGSTIEGVDVLLSHGLYDDLALAAASTYYKNRALGGKYPFYGASNALVTPIDPRFGNVLNPYRLYDLLLNLWRRSTCAPRMQDQWSEDNKTLGQCSITAFLVQDIFGGEVYGVPLGDGNFHCFNYVNGKLFDLTSEQFLPTVLTYTLEYPQSRETHFAKEEKRLRYEALKESLQNVLS